MRVDHVPCGECVNESERIAVEHVLSKLRSHGAPNNRWIVLSNVPSAVNDRAIPDEIDLVCIGPSGFFVIEVKHWDRAIFEIESPREERFHRVYRGEHIRTRNKVILHLDDLSDSDDAKPDRLASREFEANRPPSCRSDRRLSIAVAHGEEELMQFPTNHCAAADEPARASVRFGSSSIRRG